MGFIVLSFGSGVVLVCLLLLFGLQVYFLMIQNMVLFLFGVAMLFWCCDTSLIPALKHDGVIDK